MPIYQNRFLHSYSFLQSILFNGLLVQYDYDVIISKILLETILFGSAVGSILRIVQNHHYSLGTQLKNV